MARTRRNFRRRKNKTKKGGNTIQNNESQQEEIPEEIIDAPNTNYLMHKFRKITSIMANQGLKLIGFIDKFVKNGGQRRKTRRKRHN